MLIDEVAQDILFLIGVNLVGIGGILLLDLVTKLIFAAIEFSAGDDLIVDAGNDLFDDLSGRERGQTRQSNECEAKSVHRIHVGRPDAWAC